MWLGVFQTTVWSVRQRPDFSDSGQWEVVTMDRDGQEETHVFEGVLVCTGHYTQPIKPLSDFPGAHLILQHYVIIYTDCTAFSTVCWTNSLHGSV